MTDERKQFLLDQRRKLQHDAPYVFSMFAASKLHNNNIIKAGDHSGSSPTPQGNGTPNKPIGETRETSASEGNEVAV